MYCSGSWAQCSVEPDGICQHTFPQLGQRGAKVFVTGRHEGNLKRVSAAVVQEGGYSAFGAGDVAVESDVKRLYSEVC
jgi:NAD(P)-dependent dehydrogenase (short-subunit alcohol dehydrogenase family)